MYKCYHKLRSKTNAHAVICLAVMVILTVEERIQQEIYIYIYFFQNLGETANHSSVSHLLSVLKQGI